MPIVRWRRSWGQVICEKRPSVDTTRTRRHYRSELRRIERYLGRPLTVADLCTVTVEAVRDKMLADGFAINTAKKFNAALRTFGNFCASQGLREGVETVAIPEVDVTPGWNRWCRSAQRLTPPRQLGCRQNCRR